MADMQKDQIGKEKRQTVDLTYRSTALRDKKNGPEVKCKGVCYLMKNGREIEGCTNIKKKVWFLIPNQTVLENVYS